MNTYFYIDESPDLGKSKFKYFVLSCVKIDNEEENKKYLRIIKNIRTKILKKKLKNTSEIKFSNTNKNIQKKVLEKVNKLNLEIYSLVINKNYVYENLKNKIPTLYNYLMKILLEKSTCKVDKNKNLNIFLDKCMNKIQMNNFQNYIELEFLDLFKELPKVEIKHVDSQKNCGIQVIDFIVNAVRYKYEYNNKEFYNLILNKVEIEKNNLFGESK
jgi:hypothetical protein